MVPDIIVFIIILIILLAIVFTKKKSTPLEIGKELICANKGGCYRVASKFPDKKLAAETLGAINIFANTLLAHLKKKYSDTNSSRKTQVDFLLKNYNSNNIIENIPTSTVNTSYVENKGEKFALCLRENGSIQDMHTLQFVVLHELSHLITYGYGHEKEDFWTNFKFILKEAKEINLHEPIDYSKANKSYCGMNIYYNPYFDPSLGG
jgi:hypothetical protein